MNTEWKNTFNKLIAGGCGMQLGMFLTCGVTFLMVFACLGCALAGVVSLTVNDVADQLAEASRPPVASPELVTYQVAEEPLAPSLANVPAAAPIPQPEPQSEPASVVELPATGAYPGGPPPIVTATQGRVNLRIGPGTDYPRLGILPANASLPIVARNPERTWWLVTTTEGLAWVFGGAITASDLNDSIPIVDFDIPPQQISDLASITVSYPAIANTPEPPAPSSNLIYPVGTPTAAPAEQRLYVGETVGHKWMIKTLAEVPNTEGFAPRGDPILMAEGIKMHIVYGDGSMYDVLVDGNETYRVWGDGVWSPDGKYIAFAIHYKGTRSGDGTIKCVPCKAVALLKVDTKEMSILKAPDKLEAEAPRWTQDGRLLVLVHPKEPADGTVYIYNTAGQGQIATGSYLLSASKAGQKWHPWLPGRIWQAGISERPDTYYRD